MDKNNKFVLNFDDGILLPHNQMVYKKIVNALEKNNKVLFEQATGTGKSYLATKYIRDFGKGKRVLFVSPADVIKNYFIDTYNDVLGENFDCELDTCLYQGLNGVKNKNYDIIIFDEVHRMGAPIWGMNAKNVMSNNPNAKILGMTATLERADGVKVSQYFNNKEPVSRITLIDALKNGILPNPDYTIAKVDFEDDKKFVEEKVSILKEKLKTAKGNDKKQILEYLEKLAKAKKMIADHDDVGDILAKEIKADHLKKGKFIVFCPPGTDEEETAESISRMQNLIKNSKEWFAPILNGKNPKIYQMHSNYGTQHNESERIKFENDNGDNVKLLFAINMLNEGLHVGDIDGVLMFRSTSSKTIYLQQLGRALSAGNKDKQPKIFDFVANLTTAGVEEIKQVAKETKHRNSQTDSEFHIDTEDKSVRYNFDFKLNVDNLETLEFIEELKNSIYDYEHIFAFDFRDYCNRLIEYKEKYGDCCVPGNYICEDGYKLGEKTRYLRTGAFTYAEKHKAELNEIGFVWDARRYEKVEYLKRLKGYKEEYGDCIVPTNYICEDGYKLGEKTRSLRKGNTLADEEYKAELNEIGFVWDVRKYEKVEYLKRLKGYKEEYGDCLVPKRHVCEDGYKLGQKTCNLRKGDTLADEEYKAELNEIGFVWDVPRYEKEEYLKRLKEYKEKCGDCRVPNKYICEDGYKLGERTRSLRRGDTLADEEYKAELNEIGFVWGARIIKKDSKIMPKTDCENIKDFMTGGAGQKVNDILELEKEKTKKDEGIDKDTK